MSRPKRRRSTAPRHRRAPEETERRLVRAAEAVFGRKGYVDTTVANIVERARVSRGAFYLYFKDKDEIFSSLVSQVVDDLFNVSAAVQTGTFRDRVEAANRGYLEAFKRHRRVLRCLVQTTFHPTLSALQNHLRTRFIERIRGNLEKNIARGWCHPVNAPVTAYALGSMVEWVAYSWLSAGFEPWAKRFEFEEVVQELTNLWCRAVFRDGEGKAVPGKTNGAAHAQGR